MTKDSSKNITELTDIAEKFISQAESLYGSRSETEWTFVGVEVNDGPPHLAYYPERGWVAISLSPKILANREQFIFQIAHEAAHLLYPAASRHNSVRPPTITINEGVSTHFSLLMLRNFCTEEVSKSALENLRLHSPKYFNALSLVERLQLTDLNAVKKLRAIQPMLNDTTEDDFIAAGLNIDPELASALVAPF